MSHPAQRLDNAVHQRVRLGILTVVGGTTRVDFSFLRGTLDLTDGNLSRNLSVLEEAGYIAIEKSFEGRRPRTWISITPAGRQALADEIQALREIVQAYEHKPASSLHPAPQPRPAQ
ncbi:MAG TPA: transcriptional regulator [Streptosporangiaceae bacterium]